MGFKFRYFMTHLRNAQPLLFHRNNENTNVVNDHHDLIIIFHTQNITTLVSHMSAAATKSKSFFAPASKRINYWLEHHPVVSNSILCLNLWVVGDVVAQYSEHNLVSNGTVAPKEKHGENNEPISESSFWKDQLDLKRMTQCASYGAFVTGPILALWYPYMDRVCLRYKLALRYGIWAAPIAKVAADEFLMDPPTLVLFFSYMNLCEGGSLGDLVSKVRTQFFPSWYTSLAVWPAVLLGTFRYLPVPAQAPVINVCCIVWDAFLSHRNALSKNEEKANVIEQGKNNNIDCEEKVKQQETKGQKELGDNFPLVEH